MEFSSYQILLFSCNFTANFETNKSDSLRSSIKYPLLTVLILLFISAVNAQNNQNQIQLQVVNANFTLNSTSSLETAQTIPNAFSYTIRSREKYAVYCRVQNSMSSTGVNLNPSLLAVQCNSAPANSNYNKINLSSVDQLIQSGTGGGGNHYYRYNLVLEPLGYTYPPGNYNFTVLFTMTQP